MGYHKGKLVYTSVTCVVREGTMVNMTDATDEQLEKHIQTGVLLYRQQRLSLEGFTRGIEQLYTTCGRERVDKIISNIIYKREKELSYTTILPKSFTYNINEAEIIPTLMEDLQSVNREKEKFFKKIKDKLHTQLEQTLNNNNSRSERKNIEINSEAEYNSSEIQNSQGEATMRGIDYLHTNMWNDRSYKHMRSILQKCWDIRGVHPADRFDIDMRFKLSSSEIANYTIREFPSDTINLAHTKAIEDLRQRGRGRPKGARNRSKVLGQTNTNLGELEDILGTDDNEPSTLENTEFQTKPEISATTTTGDFVTRPELVFELGKVRNDISKVADAINSAIRDEFNALEQKVNNLELHKPTIVELKRVDLPNINLGVQHKAFPLLLKICSAQMRNGNRVIPWVYGPAGTGKSTAAENVAKALTPGRFYTLGKTLAKFDVLGFINTSGYQTTEFRRAYENGGVFCADEMDSWSNEASVALNGALANGHCAFPDKTVKRHPDFIMICCANTTGAGATMDYVGRTKVDAATLDRFVSLYFPLDEALEDSLVANKDWLHYVRHVRARANASGINPKPLITPRAAIHGEALLAAGVYWNDVVDSCLRKGLSDQQWNLIK